MASSFSRWLIILVLLLLIGYFLVLLITVPSRSPLEVSSASGLYSSKSWPACVGVNATSSQSEYMCSNVLVFQTQLAVLVNMVTGSDIFGAAFCKVALFSKRKNVITLLFGSLIIILLPVSSGPFVTWPHSLDTSYLDNLYWF